MTAPQSWTPPAATAAPPVAAPAVAPSAAAPLVVRADRGKVRGWLSLILVLNGAIAALCLVLAMWASSTSIGAFGGAAFAITLTGCVFQMVFHSYFYGRMAGAEAIAVIGPEGVHGPTGKWVFTTLPWASITSVGSGWNAVVVHPVDGPKLVIPTRAVDTDRSTVRAAVTHFSGGRL